MSHQNPKWTVTGRLWVDKDDPTKGRGHLDLGLFGRIEVIVRPKIKNRGFAAAAHQYELVLLSIAENLPLARLDRIALIPPSPAYKHGAKKWPTLDDVGLPDDESISKDIDDSIPF